MNYTKAPYDYPQLRVHIHDLPGEGETWHNDGEAVYVDQADRLIAAGLDYTDVHRILDALYWAAQRFSA